MMHGTVWYWQIPGIDRSQRLVGTLENVRPSYVTTVNRLALASAMTHGSALLRTVGLRNDEYIPSTMPWTSGMGSTKLSTLFLAHLYISLSFSLISLKTSLGLMICPLPILSSMNLHTPGNVG